MAAWKVKEKEVSVEEAIEIAKSELQPHWYGCSPQIIGVRLPDRVTLLPLNSEFPKFAWIILCFDLTDFSGQSACLFAKEWSRRYQSQQINCLLIFNPSYSFMRDSPLVEEMLEKLQIVIPCTVDVQETLFAALNVKNKAKVILQDNQMRHFDSEGEGSLTNLEKEIHQFLWKRESGLPLLPIYYPAKMNVDVDRIEFGYELKWGRPWNGRESKFSLSQSSEKELKQSFTTPVPNQFKADQLVLFGEWSQNGECIFTHDPHALIGFHCKGERLSIVAKTLAKRPETSLISVEVNHQPAYQAIMGEHTFMDDNASSSIKVEYPALYHVLCHLPSETRQITLRFPTADLAPVALFGLRIGNTVSNDY